ncbi:hypothetical protein [Bacillus horti]|uniref:Uncharacterized protein n=1 Tax=Caldalkalibacillus horti TaxID=77523 RepID=A0ABT9VVY1_9BACI|nr:hypothetical protein [Bacillus horti]MDQ0165151.1 hypothetical protein [Bacillus horti]
MAGGTKMTLLRYSPVTLDWNIIELIVDQDFIDQNGLVIPIEHPYGLGLGLLEVYYNGQLLHPGGGYSEIDQAIQLHLGIDSDSGIPNQLEVGDEIYIKVYRNQYCSRGGGSFATFSEFNDLRNEVLEARRYRSSDQAFPSLDSRLDFIQRSIELIENGMANVDIEYEHNENGQITRQIITGEYNLQREFEFNSINQISKEIITHNETTLIKGHIWDLDTGRLLRTRVRII